MPGLYCRGTHPVKSSRLGFGKHAQASCTSPTRAPQDNEASKTGLSAVEASTWNDSILSIDNFGRFV